MAERFMTREELIRRLREIREMGFVPNTRPGNDGGVGNTLEDLLGIQENNLPLPNGGEWELKAQRDDTDSLTTLLHKEPGPRGSRIVSRVLLPRYGWPHHRAGSVHPSDEMSFRQTINAMERTDRGFGIYVDRSSGRLLVSFCAVAVDPRHGEWLATVQQRAGLGELNPQPYWDLEDLFCAASRKLHNCFYVRAAVRREGRQECYHYREMMILEGLSFERFVEAIERGGILIDFDARTRHNHGTKVRMRQGRLPDLYARVTRI